MSTNQHVSSAASNSGNGEDSGGAKEGLPFKGIRVPLYGPQPHPRNRTPEMANRLERFFDTVFVINAST